jgi:hypothetical protein
MKYSAAAVVASPRIVTSLSDSRVGPNNAWASARRAK